MKIFTLTCFLLIASGCTTASMMNYPGRSNSVYGPSNEGSRPGTFSYLNEGASFVIEQRRESAYQQMYDACNGKYSIISEGGQNRGGIATPIGGSTFYSSSQYWYISFKCD